MIRGPEKTRPWRDKNLIAALIAFLLTVAVLMVFFTLEQNSRSVAIASRDQEIKQAQALNERLEVAYSKLRDQDLTLNIVPSTPPLDEVVNPGSTLKTSLLPRSFTVAFPPYGYDTCTDKTGDGNYSCVFTHAKGGPPPPSPPTTKP